MKARRTLLTLLAALVVEASVLAPARAQSLNPAQARAIRALIQSQLKAFASRDGVKAFSYATPGIQQRFGDSARFMAMVEQGYPMVIAPVSVAFLAPESMEGAVLQPVRLQDKQGRFWLATYQLQKQASGLWRINGCDVQPDSNAGAV